jgi:hypothetical protein
VKANRQPIPWPPPKLELAAREEIHSPRATGQRLYAVSPQKNNAKIPLKKGVQAALIAA